MESKDKEGEIWKYHFKMYRVEGEIPKKNILKLVECYHCKEMKLCYVYSIYGEESTWFYDVARVCDDCVVVDGI